MDSYLCRETPQSSRACQGSRHERFCTVLSEQMSEPILVSRGQLARQTRQPTCPLEASRETRSLVLGDTTWSVAESGLTRMHFLSELGSRPTTMRVRRAQIGMIRCRSELGHGAVFCFCCWQCWFARRAAIRNQGHSHHAEKTPCRHIRAWTIRSSRSHGAGLNLAATGNRPRAPVGMRWALQRW